MFPVPVFSIIEASKRRPKRRTERDQIHKHTLTHKRVCRSRAVNIPATFIFPYPHFDNQSIDRFRMRWSAGDRSMVMLHSAGAEMLALRCSPLLRPFIILSVIVLYTSVVECVWCTCVCMAFLLPLYLLAATNTPGRSNATSGSDQ